MVICFLDRFHAIKWSKGQIVIKTSLKVIYLIWDQGLWKINFKFITSIKIKDCFKFNKWLPVKREILPGVWISLWAGSLSSGERERGRNRGNVLINKRLKLQHFEVQVFYLEWCFVIFNIFRLMYICKLGIGNNSCVIF